LYNSGKYTSLSFLEISLETKSKILNGLPYIFDASLLKVSNSDCKTYGATPTALN
jgi:hypothetical protein